ncbi:MAG: hypothetical protein JNM42_07660 [Propionivibrio sp.]|uniref:hypothetical protein n=1 Tax=Propionivibrio sp. TaxID=2212460 RepID=UPI001A6238F4|nr:hypothetical protein [Propionivibrio sp.]MBL8414296.1 hypothetical protein [Propionivibrio sp.]
MFISVPAYQFVQTILQRLRAHDTQESCPSLRVVLAVQRRVTASFMKTDVRTLQLRKATRPEPDLVPLYDALGLKPTCGVRKLIS